jgi:hypothetical protein
VVRRGDYQRQYEPLWYGWRDGLLAGQTAQMAFTDLS